MKKKLLVSVSGGRTSGLMAKLLFDRFQNEYKMLFVFANTGREKEETLQFVNDLTVYFGIPIVWVEAVVHFGTRKGCTHRVVDFESASRNGEPFEEVIKKYGIPNTQFLHCTRELKANPIKSYAKSIGWGNSRMYTTAIGYRADEPKRINLIKANTEKQYYPLYEWNIRKPDVLSWWKKQPFDLNLKGEHQGNCKMCYKKTDRKIMTQIIEEPNDKWIEEMERKYSFVTSKKGNEAKPPFLFFRRNRTFNEIKSDIDRSFIPYSDDNKISFDFDLDEIEYGGCAESCEPF